MPCCYCSTNYNVEAHHLRGVGLVPGIGKKEDDSLTIPLCREHHAFVHTAEGKKVINQLWHVYRIMRTAVSIRDVIGCDFDFSCYVIESDRWFLLDFARLMKEGFASGKIKLT